MSSRYAVCAGLGAAWLIAACGGGSSGGGTGPCTPGAATQLVKNAGDMQAWFFNNPLPTMLSVKALDAKNCAVPGVVINWTVASGGGGVTPAQSTTNSSGLASASDSIGSGAQSVSATPAITTLPTLTFTATGSAAPTTGAVSVKDNFFDPNDVTVQVGGTVTWTWAGAAFHNVTFTSGPAPLPANGPNQSSGTYTSAAITNLGTYTYHCTNHAGMTATLHVVH